MENRRHLPIGLQSFRNVRNRNCVYVDKTRFVWELANDNHPYFLSRPRRFGKSLLISTMECYFLAEKELFKGLAIEELEQDWVKYPVLKISFGETIFENSLILKDFLDSILSDFEEEYNIKPLCNENYSGRLADILKNAYNMTKKQVVVLIDDCDKPVTDAICTEYEEKNKEILTGFYSPLKDSDDYINFLFMTGTTKVNFATDFGGLNQLDDITKDKRFSSICGISETELEENFQTEIEALAEEQKLSLEETKAKLAKKYDEYHFSADSEGVYNPFCLLECFQSRGF